MVFKYNSNCECLNDYIQNLHYRGMCFRDVVPFLDAVQNMTVYYTTRGVDVFKQAISGLLPITPFKY